MRILISVLLLMTFLSCHQKIATHLEYYGETKPGIEPQIFAEDVISLKSQSEYGSVFTKKGDEFYFGVDLGDRSEIRFSKIENNKWTTAQSIALNQSYSFNDPFLSPDETRLYYISNMPRDDLDTIPDIDIWYSNKIDDSWSEPINAGPIINSDKNEYYISFTATGDMYFSSNKNAKDKRQRDFDIYRSDYENNSFQVARLESDSINTDMYEADVFISPDESYIIFCSVKRSGLGNGDLYISFKDSQNNWTKAVNMGEPINSKNHELCPYVTPDGKYLFYTTNQDIYWVSAQVIDIIKSRTVLN